MRQWIYAGGMNCGLCRDGLHRLCKGYRVGCNCQHRELTWYRVRTDDEISASVGRNLRKRVPEAVQLNADVLPFDC